MAEQCWTEWMCVVKQFFDNSTRCLTDEQSKFAPKEGMFTVAGQVYHVAHTYHWFIDGAFTDKGWDMNFEGHVEQCNAVANLTEARVALEKGHARLLEVLKEMPEEKLHETFAADDPIFAGKQKHIILSCIEDHTAHHRGALAVYSRLLGLAPDIWADVGDD